MPDSSLAQALMALSFALPSFVMGVRMFAVWREPMAIEKGRWVQLGVGVFVLEFVMLHAGVLVGSITTGKTNWSPLGGMVLLAVFYGLFAGAIALGFKSRMLFLSFVYMLAGRFAALAIGMSQEDQALITAHSVVAMTIYFPLVVTSPFLPWPRLGISDDVARAARMPGSSGVWVDEPHRAIGPATVYFILLGIAELAILSWVDPRGLVPN